MEGFKTINIVYPSQINLVRGESSLLFFMYRNTFGFGIDLSGYDASLVIKRYPTSEKILFFMDKDTVLHGATFPDFVYSPTASTIGYGGSSVNSGINEEDLTGGMIFPIYEEDSQNLPKGNYFYEISIRSNQERRMLFEGRINIDDPKQSLTSAEVRRKDINMVRGEDIDLFFRHTDNFGNGIGLSGRAATFTTRRYPSSPSFLARVDSGGVFVMNGQTSQLGNSYVRVDVGPTGQSLIGGILFNIPNSLSSELPHGNYFYEVGLSGSSGQTASRVIYDGRVYVIPSLVEPTTIS